MPKPTVASMRRQYFRDVHYEVLDGVALIEIGKKRDGKPRFGMAIVVYHFTDERDAKAFARRQHRDKVICVDRQRREELPVSLGRRKHADGVS